MTGSSRPREFDKLRDPAVKAVYHQSLQSAERVSLHTQVLSTFARGSGEERQPAAHD